MVLGAMVHPKCYDMPPVKIRFGGETIHETQKVCNLGVEMDQHLTFQPHIDLLTRRPTVEGHCGDAHRESCFLAPGVLRVFFFFFGSASIDTQIRIQNGLFPTLICTIEVNKPGDFLWNWIFFPLWPLNG